jgi:copper chaperone
MNMETKKFKTNVKCSGCIAKVTPFLDEAVGQNNWEVDIQHPSKVLTVGDSADENKVLEAIRRAGYEAERL